MKFIYNFLINTFHTLLPVLGIFFKRLKLFYTERQRTSEAFKIFIEENKKPIIWIHVASLGEYEQVVPVIEQLKSQYSNHAFLLSFFSDSGYRVKKGKSVADFETYLPLDTPKFAGGFVKQVNPNFVLFVKYDIWPNYLKAIENHGVNAYLIAARFRPNQIYFKAFGGLFKNALKSFKHVFVQDKDSGHLLDGINYETWTQSGDTRYDRVILQLSQNNTLDFIEDFVDDRFCVVCGSTWPEDDAVITTLINESELSIKYVIAPHQIKDNYIEETLKNIDKPCVRFSEKSNKNLAEFDVLILDTVGLLNKVYAYANVAYVGGAMGNKGLHNILEPAVFGIPIIIGPNHEKFPEAKALQNKGGLKVVNQHSELKVELTTLFKEIDVYNKMSSASKQFIESQTGATEITVSEIIKNEQTQN
jgi:3-deoxy-D-manno-octulosonic-acid transferase